MASEKLRQREVHKYYQAWLDSSVGFDATPSSQPSRYHADGSQLKISKDKTLIAFAQLACLRLDVKRSIVTLISTDQQYILAEATKTLSLVSGDGDSKFEDQIWFGNASLPRSQGISGSALFPPTYTAISANGTTYTAPALIIDDLRLHDVYKSRPYAGKGVTFYCGVPILTESGIPIGVYTVVDEKPRNGLNPDELRFVHDMAATVMRHLDVVGSEAARFRGETMVLGLGRFVSGGHSLQDESFMSTRNSTQDASPDQTSVTKRSVRDFKGMTITAANPSKIRSMNVITDMPSPKRQSDRKSVDILMNTSRNKGNFESSFEHPHTDVQSAPEVPGLEDENQPGTSTPLDVDGQVSTMPDNIFSRAAKILQECVAADGVLFFDAVSINSTRRTNVGGLAKPEKYAGAGMPPPNSAAQSLGEVGTTSERQNSNVSYYSCASEESDIGTPIDTEKRMCRLLGHALDSSGSALSDLDLLDNIQMTERSLSRLVKMYPEGKLFSFHADSGLSASEAEHLTEDSEHASKTTKSDRVVLTDNTKRIPRAIADELARLVPHAQSIVWLPLWDFSKQRWSAGLFLWSRRPDRLVAAQDDLVYLKAFANSIMVEVVRQDAAIADTAKSTFIANISHELRTPLHGILGNLDILQDTKLSDFQQSLITAIEVCGRILSDTIDHVLDYSKINQLNKFTRKRDKSNSALPPFRNQNARVKSGISMIEENFNIASVVEEAIEAAYSSHAFQSSSRTRIRAPSITGHQSSTQPPSTLNEVQSVNVIFEVEHRDSWWVYSQPSAVRRVITNLFGNALKYTDAGSVRVTLLSPQPTKMFGLNSNVPILLSVRDTGRGMSADFVRNHAFTPFSQESQFSTGTGLGLSIVQQIVKSLGGRIELQSDQGIGTEIRVFLDLPLPNKDETVPQNTASTGLSSVSRRTSGLNMVMTTPKGKNINQASSGLASTMSSIEIMAQAWFGLHVVHADISERSDSDLIMFITPPTWEELVHISRVSTCPQPIRFLVVVSNTIEKAELTAKYAGTESTAEFHVDVLSHPVGPQKLGQILSRYLDDSAVELNSECQKSDMVRDTSAPGTLSKELLVSANTVDEMAPNHQSVTEAPHTQSQPLLSASIHGSPINTSCYQEQPRPVPTSQQDVTNPDTSLPEVSMKDSAGPLRTESQSRPPTIMPRSISAPIPHLPSDDTKSMQSLLRVLLVDDNDINLTILKTCMKRAKISYDFAKDGLEASNTFQHAYNTESPFTHVLMDISMPVMDGIQSTREIREFERKQNSLSRVSSRTAAPDVTTSPPPVFDVEDHNAVERAFVIALSGVASENTQLEMLEAGADMFLPKPVKLRELLKILGT